MNPSSIDIRDMILAESSIGLTDGTDLHVADMPDVETIPDLCVAVFDIGAWGDRAGLARMDQERPMVQVRVRGRKGGYTEARALVDAIVAALHGTAKAGTEINGARYAGLWLQGDVLHLGRDGKGRDDLAANFRVWRSAVV